MKRVLICLVAVYCLLGFSMTVSAAGEVKKTSDKGVAADAKDVKTETVEIYKESKDAIVRDAKEIKENIPKDLKEAKDSAVQQSKEIKESTKKEFKEIRDNMKNTFSKPKPENK